jgi:hypothetical protein
LKITISTLSDASKQLALANADAIIDGCNRAALAKHQPVVIVVQRRRRRPRDRELIRFYYKHGRWPSKADQNKMCQ